MKKLEALNTGDVLVQSQWLTVTQEMINQFAEVTGDHQWIHVDDVRCQNESPFDTTIAHGFLSVSLMPKAFSEVMAPSDAICSTVNYGMDKLRFLQPVKNGDSVKYEFTVVGIEDKAQGKLYSVDGKCILKSSGVPALVGRFLVLAVM